MIDDAHTLFAPREAISETLDNTLTIDPQLRTDVRYAGGAEILTFPPGESGAPSAPMDSEQALASLHIQANNSSSHDPVQSWFQSKYPVPNASMVACYDPGVETANPAVDTQFANVSPAAVEKANWANQKHEENRVSHAPDEPSWFPDSDGVHIYCSICMKIFKKYEYLK